MFNEAICMFTPFHFSRMGKRNQDALKKLGLPGPSWVMPLFGTFPYVIKQVSTDRLRLLMFH